MEGKYLLNDINQLPERTGIYLFKNHREKYIYIGKAKNIKKRVLQHYHSKDPKENQLMSDIEKIEFILTPSEIDSLILEQKKINELDPKYNVRFRDDKSYPYIKITYNEKYPRVTIARKLKTEEEGTEFLGPFTNKLDLMKSLNYIRTIFPIANCKKIIKEKSRNRPCLEYGIKRCIAPCFYDVSIKKYNELINYLKMFFQGKGISLIQKLEIEMTEASEKQEYEKAALIRDRLFALKKIIKRKIVNIDEKTSIDFITSERYSSLALIGILSVNKEGIANQSYYQLGINELNTSQEIYESFILNYYKNGLQFPDKIIIDSPEDKFNHLINEYITKENHKAILKLPSTNIEIEFMNLLKDSTKTELKRIVARKYSETRKIEEISEELKKIFQYYNFKKDILRIEGYDISNIMGNEAVGSKVLFINGYPEKKGYRKYKIKTVHNQNDFAMIKEVILRRFKNMPEKNNLLPDLILIDGGKGQLNSALLALNQLGIKLPVLSLAKEFEEVYVPNSYKAFRYTNDSSFLNLLKYVRDEAHRFAVKYHRKISSKKIIDSIFDSIKGIGPIIKKRIYEVYDNIEDITKETPETIKNKLKINLNLAKKLISKMKEKLN